MAVKDFFNKAISYFDTDDLNDVEEEHFEDAQEEPERPNRVQATTAATQAAPNMRTTHESSQAHPSERAQQTSARANISYKKEPRGEKSTAANRRDHYQQLANQEQTTIALKYPRKYEDAQEIVDLLISNECVLIDFQYMLDAQARRCLDFIDGASKVLYGSLQRVGPSMYLLTPSNVSVNIEDMNIPNPGQDISFDFDMKRR
ncbi:cell division protein SepF [Streptococcus halichoeri]|uniref:cell division protein SepF n=1 Tax=Streptococcus halichoeri TaxID=254785 RepID=UPI000DB8D1CF|nr:cell division protein SepF [Streptococcus halichoeri]PZO95485.1 MAG: cell division protein SepF [Streptococcus pyogenes]